MRGLLSETVNHKLSAEGIIFLGPDLRAAEHALDPVALRRNGEKPFFQMRLALSGMFDVAPRSSICRGIVLALHMEVAAPKYIRAALRLLFSMRPIRR